MSNIIKFLENLSEKEANYLKSNFKAHIKNFKSKEEEEKL